MRLLPIKYYLVLNNHYATNGELLLNKLQNNSILGLLGLANRARQMKGGAVAVKDSIRRGKASLVLLATDASDGTKRWVNRLAEIHAVPVLENHTRIELGASYNNEPKAVLSVVDRNFANGILKKSGIQSPVESRDFIKGGKKTYGE